MTPFFWTSTKYSQAPGGGCTRRRQGVRRRHADRRGRQALVQVGVVGRLDLEVLARHRAAVLAEGVEDGRVHLQRHVLGQAVVDDPGHVGHVDRDVALLLHHRGRDDHLVGGEARARPPRPCSGRPPRRRGRSAAPCPRTMVVSVSPGRIRYSPVPSIPSRSSEPGGEKTECTAPLAATFSKPPAAWPGRLSTCSATSVRVKPGPHVDRVDVGPGGQDGPHLGEGLVLVQGVAPRAGRSACRGRRRRSGRPASCRSRAAGSARR